MDDVRARLHRGYYTNPEPYPRFNPNEMKAHRAKTIELEGKFKEDLFEEFGIAQHSKRELLWTKVWDMSHAHGLEEVYYTFANLVELIK